MGFYSYIVYKQCFDWAYGGRVVIPGTCNVLIENEADRVLITADEKIFCVKSE